MMDVYELVKILIPYQPDVERYLEWAQTFPQREPFYRKKLLQIAAEIGLNLRDPFLPHPSLDALDNRGEGATVGRCISRDHHFAYDEPHTGIAFLGSPNSGKSTAQDQFILNLKEVRPECGCFCPDLRGDHRQIAQCIDDALLVTLLDYKWNPWESPPGVPPKAWAEFVVARLTDDLGLRDASKLFAMRTAIDMVEEFAARGQIPSMADFRDCLANARVAAEERGPRNRLLGRISTLLNIFGPIFDCQQGHPIMREVENGRLVVLEVRGDKLICDLISAFHVFWVYYRRLYSKDPFNHPTVIFALDEQRNLTRARSDAATSDMEVLFSRARALRLGWLISEQIPSSLSPAAVTACTLRLGFRTVAPESAIVSRLLGLTPQQAAFIPRLPTGQCIVRYGGARVPDPFLLQIEKSPDLR